MLHLGGFLQQAREEKGLSLEDMQDLTKIKSNYLRAIEQGNYDLLPGLFYARAFVKTYCEALGLPAKDVLEIYASDLPGGNDGGANDKHLQPGLTQVETSVPRWRNSIIIWGVAIALLLAVYYFVTMQDTSTQNGESENSQKQSQNQTQTQKPSDKPATPPAEEPTTRPEPTATENVKEISRSLETFQYEVRNATTIKMELTATGPCYVHYGPTTDRDKIEQSATLDTGQSVTWEYDKNTRIRVGAINFLSLKVNGVPLDFGDSGGVRTLIFDRK